jgi:Probable cobalt transporter subunit (CbtB)
MVSTTPIGRYPFDSPQGRSYAINATIAEAGVIPARSRRCIWLPWRPEVRPAGGMEHIIRDAVSQENDPMSDTTLQPGHIATPIPVREILPWAIFAALALLAIYFVGAEEGATSLIPGMYVHEFLHDGRHLLGFPCH